MATGCYQATRNHTAPSDPPSSNQPDLGHPVESDGPVDDGADCQGGTDMSVHLKTLGVGPGWRLMVWDDRETSLVLGQSLDHSPKMPGCSAPFVCMPG